MHACVLHALVWHFHINSLLQHNKIVRIHFRLCDSNKLELFISSWDWNESEKSSRMYSNVDFSMIRVIQSACVYISISIYDNEISKWHAIDLKWRWKWEFDIHELGPRIFAWLLKRLFLRCVSSSKFQQRCIHNHFTSCLLTFHVKNDFLIL